MTAPKTNPAQELTQGRLLARNTILNVLGYSLPMLVAIFAIPPLVKGLGTERFGILTLAWVIIGYLSLFDLGLGRALTKLVAEKLGTGQTQKIPALIWTSLFVMFFLGILVAFAASWFFRICVDTLCMFVIAHRMFFFATWFKLLDTNEKGMVLARSRMFGSQIDDP